MCCFKRLSGVFQVGSWIKDNSTGETNENDITAMVQKYITEIEELRAKLLESENLAEQLRKDSARIKRLSQINSSPLPTSKTSTVFSPMTNNWTVDEDSGVSSSVQELIQLAKKDLEKNKEERKFVLIIHIFDQITKLLSKTYSSDQTSNYISNELFKVDIILYPKNIVPMSTDTQPVAFIYLSR